MVLNITPSPTPGGFFDFNPVFPGGTAGAPTDQRGVRPFPETRIRPQAIDILDFLPSCQKSAGMIELVAPLNLQINEQYDLARSLQNLGDYDLCDQRFLSHLAGNYGFELIDLPYATERERRRLVRDAFWIMKRRGTLWPVQRIIEDLGFTATFSEDYQISGRWNKHKFWSRMGITSEEHSFNWDDSSMQGFANESLGNFKAIAQRLRGSALTGTLAPTMSATFPQTTSDYNLQVDYRLLSTGDCWFGVVARYESATKALLVTLDKSGASENLTVYAHIGTWAPLHVVDISGTTWRTGDHTISIWDTGDKITVILDDVTLIYQQNYAALVASVKKGLFCAFGTEVEFDNYVLRVLDRRKQPKFFASGQADKTLTITLSGTVQFEDAKREYLETIIPKYVPIDVTVVWV
ncbi:MAG: phage tail protein [Candidatus Zixiibacteriota bacterium]